MAARTPAKRLMMSSRSARGSGKVAGRSRNLPGRGIADADHRVAPALPAVTCIEKARSHAAPFGTHFRPARQFTRPTRNRYPACSARAGVAAAAFTQTLGLTVVQDAGGVWLTIQ